MEEQNFNFKPFEGKNTKATEYFISVTKAFGFGLSAGFCKKHQILINYDYALILMDKDKNTVGFKLFNKENKIKGSFAITKGKHSASVMSLSWFKENNINPAEYADKYDINEYNDPNFGKIFYIKLAKKDNTNEE